MTDSRLIWFGLLLFSAGFSTVVYGHATPGFPVMHVAIASAIMGLGGFVLLLGGVMNG